MCLRLKCTISWHRVIYVLFVIELFLPFLLLLYISCQSFKYLSSFLRLRSLSWLCIFIPHYCSFSLFIFLLNDQFCCFNAWIYYDPLQISRKLIFAGFRYLFLHRTNLLLNRFQLLISKRRALYLLAPYRLPDWLQILLSHFLNELLLLFKFHFHHSLVLLLKCGQSSKDLLLS